jgi:hypothetical protein
MNMAPVKPNTCVHLKGELDKAALSFHACIAGNYLKIEMISGEARWEKSSYLRIRGQCQKNKSGVGPLESAADPMNVETMQAAENKTCLPAC